MLLQDIIKLPSEKLVATPSEGNLDSGLAALISAN